MKRTMLILLLASGTAFAAAKEEINKTLPASSDGKPVVDAARDSTGTSSNGASRGPGVEFEMKVHRLSPRVAMVIAGPWATKVIGIATAKGIVVIDAPHSRTLAKQSRDALAREFGRSDFACLILTHEHACHVGGTEAYADLPILGHESVYRDMSRAMTDPTNNFSAAAMLAFAEKEPERSRADLAKYDPKTLESPRYKASLTDWGVIAADWRTGEKIVPPTITFDRAMTLHFGDVTLVLEFFGHAHSIGDTVVRVEKMK